MQLQPQSDTSAAVQSSENGSTGGGAPRSWLGRILDSPWFSLPIWSRDPDRFVDQVGHELKTPLTSIRSLSEILRDNPMLPPKMREQYIKIILSESHRLESVVSVLLDGMSDPDVICRSKSRESLLERIASVADQARRQGGAH